MNRTVFLIIFLLAISNGCKNSIQEKAQETDNTVNENIISPLNNLRFERELSVEPVTVFEVFTNPEMMGIWWTETTTFDVDLVPGGKWKIIRTEGENVYTALGEYLEIDKPNRVKYTYAMPQFSSNVDTIEIIINPDGDSGSVVTFIHSGIDISAELGQLKEGEKSGSELGWQMAFDIIESRIGKK